MKISAWILGIFLFTIIGYVMYLAGYLNKMEDLVAKFMIAQPLDLPKLQNEAYELFEKQPDGAGRVVKR